MDAARPLPDPLPVRANLGCGYDIRAGYLNVDLHDRHGPDLAADVTDLSMLPSGHFEEILAQDVLEHLERHKTVPTLAEWARLLRPGGLLHLRVPSLLDLFEFLAAPEWRSLERTEEAIHLLYGTQGYAGDYHLAGFTAPLLDAYLARAGLAVCRADLLHGWLYEVSARKAAALTDPMEIAHAAYFRVLQRAGDPDGLAHFAQRAAAGASQEAIEAELRDSDEARFLAANPLYLRRHRHRLTS